MNGKLGNDVREQEMAVVPRGGVNTVLREQTGPGIGHKPAQLVTLFLVGGIVNVLRALIHQQAGELKDQDSHVVASSERIFGINDVENERGHHVDIVLNVGGWWGANELLPLAVVERPRERRNKNVLQYLGL